MPAKKKGIGSVLAEAPPRPTFCETCDNCLIPNKSDHPRYWLCTKHPRLEGFGFVTKGTWDNWPPYLYCRDVNGGLCPLFVRKRESENADASQQA